MQDNPTPALPDDAEGVKRWFFVGTDGDFNYQAICAASEADAKEQWLEEWGDNDHSLNGITAHRVSAWDGKDIVTHADILGAGYGTICDKCGYETFPQEGGEVIGDKVLCEDCKPVGANHV